MKISLSKLEALCPEQTVVKFMGKDKNHLTFRFVTVPHVSEQRHDKMINDLRDLIGAENIMEFYTETIGYDFFIYVRRPKTEPIEVEFDGQRKQEINL